MNLFTKYEEVIINYPNSFTEPKYLANYANYFLFEEQPLAPQLCLPDFAALQEFLPPHL